MGFSTCYRVCKRTAWILIGLRGCAGWSGSMLVANPLCWFCHDTAHFCVASYIEADSCYKEAITFLWSVRQSVCPSFVQTTPQRTTISSKIYTSHQYQVQLCISAAFTVQWFLVLLWPFNDFHFLKFCLDYFSYTTYAIWMKLYRVDRNHKYFSILNRFPVE
jgi:hypothetical protein